MNKKENINLINPVSDELEEGVIFVDEETEEVFEKKKSRKKQLGQRKERLHNKKLAKENVFVEKKERVAGKPYYKVSPPSKNDDGYTKKEVKKDGNRKIRRANSSIPNGSAYKKGSEAVDYDEK